MRDAAARRDLLGSRGGSYALAAFGRLIGVTGAGGAGAAITDRLGANGEESPYKDDEGFAGGLLF